MTVIWKMMTMLWPFMLELCAGRRMGFMEAYKTKPKQLMIAISLSGFLFIALLAMMRLYSLSIEVVERNKEISELTNKYNTLAKKYNEPPMKTLYTPTVVQKPIQVTQTSPEPTVTPNVDITHQDDVTNALAKIKTDSEK